MENNITANQAQSKAMLPSNRKNNVRPINRTGKVKAESDGYQGLEPMIDGWLERFKKTSFKGRVKMLSYVRGHTQEGAKIEGEPVIKEARDIFGELLALMVKKHINITVKEVSEKYAINNRPATEEDFYRICETENIIILNNRPHPTKENSKLTVACIFPVKGILLWKDLKATILSLDDRLEGEAKLRQMFHLLGFYFLHQRAEIAEPNLADTGDKKIADAQGREAKLFSRLMVKKASTDTLEDYLTETQSAKVAA